MIRRFARYHHLDAMFDATIDDSAATIERLCVLHFGSCDSLDVMRLVQTLTRIESAEMLDAQMAAEYQDTWYQRRERAALGRSYAMLLRSAGIDPAKWREVKDEEA